MGGGEWEEGKKGRSCLPNLNLFDHVLYVIYFVLYPKGIIFSKTPSLKSKIITPSTKEKIVISKLLTYRLRRRHTVRSNLAGNSTSS